MRPGGTRARSRDARPRLGSAPVAGSSPAVGVPARGWDPCRGPRPQLAAVPVAGVSARGRLRATRSGLLLRSGGPPGRATAARGLAIKLHWISSEFGTFKFSTSYVSRRARFRAPAQHVTHWRFPAAPLAPGPRLPRLLGVLEVHLPKNCDWPRRLRAPSAAGCCLVFSQRWLYCSVLVWLLGFLLLCSGSVKCQAGKRGGTGMNYS